MGASSKAGPAGVTPDKSVGITRIVSVGRRIPIFAPKGFDFPVKVIRF